MGIQGIRMQDFLKHMSGSFLIALLAPKCILCALMSWQKPGGFSRPSCTELRKVVQNQFHIGMVAEVLKKPTSCLQKITLFTPDVIVGIRTIKNSPFSVLLSSFIKRMSFLIMCSIL